MSGVDPGPGADEAIRRALEASSLADGERFRKVEKVYRVEVIQGSKLSKIAYAQVELPKEKASRVTDHFGQILVKVGKRTRKAEVRVSPYCKGCHSRDHVLSGCPWLKMGLRLENVPQWPQPSKARSTAISPTETGAGKGPVEPLQVVE